jgi:pimeloyl-ACP methyl ester carboxylesterase
VVHRVMRRALLLAVVALLAPFASRDAMAQGVTCTPSGHEPSKLGVVLLHGNWTLPLGGGNRIPAFDTHISSLASSLRAAGFRVVMPEMPWSRNHVYDRTYEQAMDEIAAAAGKLNAQGAESIVVAGHSMGANAALGYAALRGGIVGVIALAPGHDPAMPRFREAVQSSVDRALAMVKAGKGSEQARFEDVNAGRTGTVVTTAAQYLSFFDPDGNAAIPRNAGRLPAGVPLLWVAAEDDPLSHLGPAYAFAKAPPNPLSQYVVVPGGHLAAPDSAISVVIAWLNCL